MAAHRDGWLIDIRGALVVLGAVALAPRSAHAQQYNPPISGSVVLMGSLGVDALADFVGRITLEPSSRALAPWVSAGVRWNGPLERSPHAVGSFGLRYRHRAVRMGIGLSRDVAYMSVSEGTRAPRDTIGPGPLTTSAGGQGPEGAYGLVPTRTGYTARPVADVVASAAWSASRLAVGIEAGRRLAGPALRRHWFSATAATPLVHQFSLVAAVVQRHELDFSRGGMQVKVGFAWRSAPWSRRASSPSAPPAVQSDRPAIPSQGSAPVFVVRPIPDGIQLRFHAPNAQAVEVRSDLTTWMPAHFQRDVDGYWNVELAASPGVHRLAIRVDEGEWLPPPGLPVGSDGYGSAVGLVVVDH